MSSSTSSPASSVAASPSLLQSLGASCHELVELEDALDLLCDRSFSGGDYAVLRTAVTTQMKRLQQEVLKFTLVMRSEDGTVPVCRILLNGISEAAATFVAGIQLATKEGACGAALRKELRASARRILRCTAATINGLHNALGSCSSQASGVGPSSASSSSSSSSSSTSASASSITSSTSEERALKNAMAAYGDALVRQAGSLSELCDAFSILPPNDYVLCRRRVLLVCKLVKSSATEICEEKGYTNEELLKIEKTALSSAEGAEGSASTGSETTEAVDSAATIALSAISLTSSAAAPSAAAAASSSSSSSPAPSSSASSLSPFEAAAHTQRRIQFGILALRHIFDGLKKILGVMEDALSSGAVVAGKTLAAPSSASNSSASTSAASTTSSSATAATATSASHPLSTAPPTAMSLHLQQQAQWDALANAASQLSDAVIDFAAALNDYDESSSLAEGEEGEDDEKDGTPRSNDTSFSNQESTPESKEDSGDAAGGMGSPLSAASAAKSELQTSASSTLQALALVLTACGPSAQVEACGKKARQFLAALT